MLDQKPSSYCHRSAPTPVKFTEQSDIKLAPGQVCCTWRGFPVARRFLNCFQRSLRCPDRIQASAKPPNNACDVNRKNNEEAGQALTAPGQTHGKAFQKWKSQLQDWVQTLLQKPDLALQQGYESPHTMPPVFTAICIGPVDV